MVEDVIISQKNPTDKIFPRTYMDFEQKYQKDPGMNRVKFWCIFTNKVYIPTSKHLCMSIKRDIF